MIATVEPLQVFLINSEINAYIQSRQDLLADQINLSHEDNPFLEHDSVLNCIEAHRAFNITHLKQKMLENFSQIYKGKLNITLLQTVIDVVENSVNLPRITKNQVINAIKEDNAI